MIQQLLDMINRQKMLAIHRNNNSVPNLRNQDLWFILNLHVRSSQDLGIDTLGESGEDVSPWGPDRHTEVERPGNGEDSIPDNIPKIGIQEE